MTNEITLNFLTLNCWGIPYVSKNRQERMLAIAEKFAAEKYDIICLQEVWSLNDFRMMRSLTQDQLPYSHYFHSGVFGSGICILSKYPILDVIFHKWPLNGYVHKIHHGDWFGGKGVGLCRLRIQNMNVNVYIVHLHAEYNASNDEYMAHRVLQAFDTAQFIRMTRAGADAVILGGDLNAEPQDLAYKIICGVAGLMDACSNSSSNIGTNECANNSYTGSRVARTCPNGKRIDHILYLGSRNFIIDVVDYQHPFPNRVPNKNFSYSDHEAVMASFRISAGTSELAKVDVNEHLKQGVAICETALKSIWHQRLWYFLGSCLLIIPLVWIMGIDCAATSAGATIGLNTSRILLTAILCYALFMSSIWSSIEENSLKASCLAIEKYLLQLSHQIEY